MFSTDSGLVMVAIGLQVGGADADAGAQDAPRQAHHGSLPTHIKGLRYPPMCPPGDNTTCHNWLSRARNVAAQHKR